MMSTQGATLRRWGFILVLAAAAPGCGGDAGSGATSDASLAPMCGARPDGATPGCFAQPSSMLCTPSGCDSLCGAGLTPVTCTAQAPVLTIPAPAPDAGCTIVRIPTPSTTLFYCCPCPAR